MPSPSELEFKPSGMLALAGGAQGTQASSRAQDNQLEKAVELFANVLQSRIEHYGGLSLAYPAGTSGLQFSA